MHGDVAGESMNVPGFIGNCIYRLYKGAIEGLITRFVNIIQRGTRLTIELREHTPSKEN